MPLLPVGEPPSHHRNIPLQAPDNGFGNEGKQGVAVLLPAGTYRITKMIEITQSNVVVRGEGVSAGAAMTAAAAAAAAKTGCRALRCL